MKKYDIIYSIGRDCSCATYLKNTNLRLCSGPFDWLTNAGFEDRMTLLLNDFQYFLDKEYLHLMEKPTQFPADKNNDYYENTKTHLYFWHDFPANKSFDEAYFEVKQKYDRRIKRFYENIQKKKRVLLVWLSQVHSTQDSTIIDLCNRFCKKIGKQVDFLIIEHIENLKEVESVQLRENIVKYSCHATKFDEHGVPQTLGNEELILPIFKQYKLAIPCYVALRTVVLNAFVKTLCLIIPVKKIRKKLRRLCK